VNPEHDIARKFLDVAGSLPEAPALGHGSLTLAYREVAALVEQYAGSLGRAVPAGHCVALSVRKSPPAIVLMLACLLARIPYVPIDPSAPLMRRRQILTDADPALLLVSARTVENWPGEQFDTADILEPGRGDLAARYMAPHLAVARRRDAVGSAAFTEQDIAYLLYTSGSTGTPKGVLISVTNAGYFVDWASRAFPLGRGDQQAQHAPLHFDLPVYDVFVALTSGACLHLMDERTVLFPAAVYRFLRERGITAAYAVPSALNAMVRRSAFRREGLPALRRVLYAGEEYHVPQLRELMAALPEATEVANLYGPVETNVVTWTAVDARAMAAGRVPIGRAVPGTEVRVVSEAGALLSCPADGELVVSGPSVSPGYLNDPQRTSQTRMRAVADGSESVYYRTGDFARIDDDGMVHLQGRRDGMVKIRGFRVELGDVEAALTAHPEIVQAAVLPISSPDAGPSLAAHVAAAPGAQLTPAALREWVGERLPSYMVPAEVTFHEQLPLTSTGKIARSALGGAR